MKEDIYNFIAHVLNGKRNIWRLLDGNVAVVNQMNNYVKLPMKLAIQF